SSDTPVCYLCTCEKCGNNLIYRTCLKCNSGTGNSFTYDTLPESFDEVQIIPNPPPQCHFNIYLCQICGILTMVMNVRNELILLSMSSPVNSLFSNQFRQELMKLIVILRKKLILSRDCCTITHLLVHQKNLFLKILSFMEEIDLSFTPDDPMPPGIKEDDYDSERDILIYEELLDNHSLSLLKNESFHFDTPSSSRPPAKPPDGNTGILNIKMMGDISKLKVPMPGLMITRVSNQEKSPDLLSHQGLETFQPFAECPMMIHEKNTHILDVLPFHFYPP
nr:hypothetical protein [Tanacetum cinerariifolium]